MQDTPVCGNDTETRGPIDTGLTQARSRAVRHDLIAIRAEHGHDSPIGHRCSNVLEQLENFVRAYDPDQRRRLDAAIMRQMAELSTLCRGNRG